MWMWLVFDSSIYGIIIQTFLQTGLSQLQEEERTKKKISTHYFFLGYLFDSSVMFFETTRDGCVDPQLQL